MDVLFLKFPSNTKTVFIFNEMATHQVAMYLALC